MYVIPGTRVEISEQITHGSVWYSLNDLPHDRHPDLKYQNCRYHPSCFDFHREVCTYEHEYVEGLEDL